MEHLIFIVIVVGAIGVAAFMHRDKLAGLFGKEEAPVVPVPVVQPIQTARAKSSLALESRILEAIDFLRGRLGRYPMVQELMTRLGHGLNEEEIAYAKAHGVTVAPDVVPEGPASDLSSPDLSDRAMHVFSSNGSLSVYFLHPGGPALLQIVGVSGTPFTRASGSLSGASGVLESTPERAIFNNVHEAFRGNLPAGQYSYAFSSNGSGRFGAQYQATA